MTTTPESTQFAVGSARIQLRDVRLRAEVTVDEIDLDGGDIRLTLTGDAGEAVIFRAGETKFHVMISEPRINALLDASIPDNAPIRGLRIAVLSGKIRVTGSVVKSVLHLPFTLEAIPVIDNGVRVRLDCQSAKLGSAMGVGMPAVVVELIEQHINNNPRLPLDLTRLPIPVRLDEIRCEPGRLNVSGRARLEWPRAVAPPAIAPFSARETSVCLPPEPAVAALPPTENEKAAAQGSTVPTVS